MPRWDEGNSNRLDAGREYVFRFGESYSSTSSKGNPCIKTTLVVYGGDHNGTSVRMTLPGWACAKIGKALGFPRMVDPQTNKAFYDYEPHQLEGKLIRGKAKRREYEDPTSGEKKFANDVDTETLGPVEPPSAERKPSNRAVTPKPTTWIDDEPEPTEAVLIDDGLPPLKDDDIPF